MIKLELSPEEEQVIRKAVKIQLINLRSIRDNNGPEDILLYCLESDITLDRLIKRVKKAIRKFKFIYHNPDQLLSLDEDYIRIFRHILNVLVKGGRYRESKKQIWRKLFTYEDMVLKYSPSQN